MWGRQMTYSNSLKLFEGKISWQFFFSEKGNTTPNTKEITELRQSGAPTGMSLT